MRFELGNDDSWKHERPSSGLGLRWTDEMVATLGLETLAPNVDGAVEQVDVTARQRKQLASTQAAERGKQNEHAELRLDHFGERVHLSERRERPLVCRLDSRTLDRTRVGNEEAVLDCCSEDG